MFNSKNLLRKLSLVVGIAACVFGTAACSTSDVATKPTPQGTIALDDVRVGMPETVFKDAPLTFIEDQNGSIDGKVQYLSRGRDANGGQYVVQCRGGQCYEVAVYHMDQPVAKEIAVATLDKLYPADKPAQSKVDDSEVKAATSNTPSETYFYGDTYKGQLTYADKAGSKVKIITATLATPPTM